MILQTSLEHQLDQLGHFTSPATTQQVTFSADNVEVCVQLAALDSLACEFEEITFHARQPSASVSHDELLATAARLVERLTYLYEPLAVIEADQAANVIQLRSVVPTQEETGQWYFELLVKRDIVSLRRYAGRSGHRTVEPAQVTRQVLHRLISDILHVLA